MTLRARQIVSILLLILGVQLWLILGRSNWGTQRQLHFMGMALLIGLIIALIPPLARRAKLLHDRLRHPSARTICLTALAIFLLCAAYLYFTAARQQRTFGFTSHDEYSYAIQAQMLARGRLWMPPHPAADSFDSFYLIVRPVYGSMYFPGASLFWLPAVWLHLPWWIMPLLTSALAVALTYLVIARFIDYPAALLAALLMLSLDEFRIVSLMLYAQVPLLVLGLLMILAYLRWQSIHRRTWALILGALAGFALITRPLDALIFLMPIAAAIVMEPPRASRRSSIALMLAGALPLLAFQLIANKGMTGAWFTTPHGMYTRVQFPGATLGFPAPPAHPSVQSSVPQKQQAYDDWVRTVIAEHQPSNLLHTLTSKRLPLAIAQTTPTPLLAILIPLGWLAALAHRRWIIAAGLPLLLTVYLLYPFFLRHYLIVAAPAAIAAILLGARELEVRFPRARVFFATATTAVFLAAALAALPELNRYAHDELTVTEIPQVPRILSQLKAPAVLMFQWTPQASWAEEPVYNIDVAWPDDAPVIRAHWLSDDLNRRLVQHYANHQPDRRIYVVQRPLRHDSLVYDLGTAKELADKPLIIPPRSIIFADPSRGADRVPDFRTP